MEKNDYLVIEDIHKSFFGVEVLKGVNLSVAAGEVHGLLGGNGAGKSTLMNVLGGLYAKDSGRILIDGREVSITDSKAAERAGIGFIHQELKLFDLRSVAENIMISNLPTKGVFHLVDDKKKNESARKWLEMVGLKVEPATRLGELSIAEQQQVEIAKALSLNAKILIFDEPTSSLTNRETEILFGIINKLKEKGACIIYISHKSDEIFKICDRVTVLRNGENVGTLDTATATNDELVSLIIGRKLEQYFPELPPAPGPDAEKVMEVKGLVNKKLAGVSFDVRRGEILGLFGLVGAGRSETARAIFGLDHIAAGEIVLEGKAVKITSSRTAMKHGLSFLTENRREEGLIMKMDIKKNLTFPILKRITVPGIGFVKQHKELELVKDAFRKFLIKATGPKQRVSTLSGGNQQKVVLSKWFMTDSKILILDEPTRGVDVGAKAEIYELIVEMVKKGLSVIMISCEEAEILGMCHRVLVMRDGKILGEFAHDEVDSEELVGLCLGGREVAV